MRNFVAKNDFNRASTHKSLKDYTRADSRDLTLEVLDTLDELQWEEECKWIENLDEQWEVTNNRLSVTFYNKEKSYLPNVNNSRIIYF